MKLPSGEHVADRVFHYQFFISFCFLLSVITNLLQMQDKFLVGCVTFLISIFGLITNFLVFLSVQNMAVMKSSFGLITKNQTVCNILMSLAFLFYIFPMQTSSEPYLLEYSHFFGVLLMTLYEVSVGSHLFIALNRLCTVFRPASYDTFFSIKTTNLISKLIWLISLSICTLLYEILGCHFTFNPDSSSMEFLPNCASLNWYSDFILNNVIVAITLLINLISIYKTGEYNRKATISIGISLSIGRKRRRMSFMKQALAQTTAIFIGQVSHHLFVPLFDTELLKFFFDSLWAYIHAIEGCIIIATNSNIREFLIQKLWKKKEKQVTTSSKPPAPRVAKW